MGAFLKLLTGSWPGSARKTPMLLIRKTRISTFKQDEVRTIWKEMDNLAYKHSLAIQGQPGTRTSTAVWRKILEMAIAGGNILCLSLAQNGDVQSAVYFQGRYVYQFDMVAEDFLIFANALFGYCGD